MDGCDSDTLSVSQQSDSDDNGTSTVSSDPECSSTLRLSSRSSYNISDNSSYLEDSLISQASILSQESAASCEIQQIEVVTGISPGCQTATCQADSQERQSTADKLPSAKLLGAKLPFSGAKIAKFCGRYAVTQSVGGTLLGNMGKDYQ